MPLHHAKIETADIFWTFVPGRILKRHKCRAPPAVTYRLSLRRDCPVISAPCGRIRVRKLSLAIAVRGGGTQIVPDRISALQSSGALKVISVVRLSGKCDPDTIGHNGDDGQICRLSIAASH